MDLSLLIAMQVPTQRSFKSNLRPNKGHFVVIASHDFVSFANAKLQLGTAPIKQEHRDGI
jgi:hypothetical protein